MRLPGRNFRVADDTLRMREIDDPKSNWEPLSGEIRLLCNGGVLRRISLALVTRCRADDERATKERRSGNLFQAGRQEGSGRERLGRLRSYIPARNGIGRDLRALA